MQPFNTLQATVAPLDRSNVDTDAIIPKQFLKRIERTGFGVNLFHELRYTDEAGTQENPDFALNQPKFRNSQILVSRKNFGCGSSREHAPWALLDYGFRCVIAPSFADIFYNNCFKNGILPVVLTEDEVESLFQHCAKQENPELLVQLESQTVQIPEGPTYSFEVDPFNKERLLKGLDDIGWTLQFEEHIASFENQYQQQQPWMVIAQ